MIHMTSLRWCHRSIISCLNIPMLHLAMYFYQQILASANDIPLFTRHIWNYTNMVHLHIMSAMFTISWAMDLQVSWLDMEDWSWLLGPWKWTSYLSGTSCRTENAVVHHMMLNVRSNMYCRMNLTQVIQQASKYNDIEGNCLNTGPCLGV